MIRRSEPPSLLMRAVDYLSRREYSAKALREKLLPYAESPEAVEEVIARLQKENWQSDQRFVDSFVHQKQRAWGTGRILQSLKQQNIDADALSEVREQLRDSEFSRALTVWQTRFKNKAYEDQKGFAQQMRFLIYRGFSPDIARRIIDGAPWDEEALMDASSLY